MLLIQYSVSIKSVFHITGTVPSSFCKLTTLTSIHISYDNSNPLVTCAPLCLTTVSSRSLPSTILETCPSFQDDGLCSLIAATNIGYLTNYDEWSCNRDGFTITDPCNATMWNGVTCMDGFINSISLNVSALRGTIPTALGSLSILTNLTLVNNLLYGMNYKYFIV